MSYTPRTKQRWPNNTEPARVSASTPTRRPDTGAPPSVAAIVEVVTPGVTEGIVKNLLQMCVILSPTSQTNHTAQDESAGRR